MRAAENNASDPAGNDAWSPTETSSAPIRDPVLAGIAFTRIVNKLRCPKVKKTVRRHRKKVVSDGRRWPALSSSRAP